MPRWHRPLLLALPLLASSACAHAPAGPAAPAMGTAEVRAIIETTNARFAAALVKGDAPALAALFAEDGQAIPGAAKGFVTGRAALAEYYAGRLKAARYLEATITTVEVEVSGDVAWETGTNRVVVQVGESAPVTRTGRYLVVWKRGTDGTWRYRVDAVIPDPAG
jgi:uncharacterized protein (TIGR02246 family)